MYRLCIWMDVPSHYQSAFFRALNDRDDVDLMVCYLKSGSEKRAKQGWNNQHEMKPYERCCAGVQGVSNKVALVPEWETRVHLINSHFGREIVAYFCANQVSWCHWSERPGVRLAGLLRYRMSLYRLLEPLMLTLKRGEGRQIETYGLAALGQGALARHAFRMMGVSEEKLSDLYYSPDPLSNRLGCSEIKNFAAGRRVFLSVGALCRRKGIDVLLKAFARLKTDEWCLVLCGLDRANGAYQRLAAQLGIKKQVYFLGAYSVERIAEVYVASDVFVLPSRFDGWGAVLNEAASLGLPLIGTDLCGASNHLVRPGQNGCVVRAGSVRSLMAALQFFVENEGEHASFGAASKTLFFKEFTPQRNALRLVEFLEQSRA